VIANPLYVAGNHAVPQLIHVNHGGQRRYRGRRYHPPAPWRALPLAPAAP